MGYKSKVVVKVDESLVQDFQRVLKETEFSEYNESDQLDTLVMDSIKWYHDRSDVTTLVVWLEEQDPELYGFIRLGENREDVEELGTPWEYGMYISIDVIIDNPSKDT